MMTSATIATALDRRLTSLGEEDPECCGRDYAQMSREAAAVANTCTLGRWAKALGDERRILTLALLAVHGPLCACELQASLRLSHATVSHHMAVLQEADLVEANRRGKWVYYRLTADGRRCWQAGGA